MDYSDACSVLNIMNGPWIDQASKGKFHEIILLNVIQPVKIKKKDLHRYPKIEQKQKEKMTSNTFSTQPKNARKPILNFVKYYLILSEP